MRSCVTLVRTSLTKRQPRPAKGNDQRQPQEHLLVCRLCRFDAGHHRRVEQLSLHSNRQLRDDGCERKLATMARRCGRDGAERLRGPRYSEEYGASFAGTDAGSLPRLFGDFAVAQQLPLSLVYGMRSWSNATREACRRRLNPDVEIDLFFWFINSQLASS